MTQNTGNLSVTALYTSATWNWGKLPNAELFDHAEARRVFRVVNAVLGVARPFIGLRSPLPLALLHRHTLIDVLVRASCSERVLELASGLSRRGVTFSSDPRIDYTEVDRPDMVAAKRRLLERTHHGRAALGRPNFRLLSADVQTTDLGRLSVPDGAPLFVIAEGLLMYLDADAQRRLYCAVAARLASDGGTFVFDFVPPCELPPPGRVGRGLDWAMKRWTGGQGFAHDERTRDDVIADLARCGFDRAEAIEPHDVALALGLPHPNTPTQQLVFVAHVHPKSRRGGA
jgi:O-methyltransferase involved in polyketide biosynthesis